MTFIPEMANMNHAEVESAHIPPLNRHEIHQQLLDALWVGCAHTESSIPQTLRLRKMVPPRLALMRNSHCLRKLLNRHEIHQQLLDALWV